LMVVVAPMLWMGAPVVPLLVGLPRSVRGVVLRALNGPGLRLLTRWLLHPAVGWIAFALAFWAWHAPALYDLALESDLWHHVEHTCFLVSALLFWRPVILAWPARMAWPRWTMVPYLGLAMFQSLPLATILTFSDRVIYAGHSSVDDQALAGLIMWVPGSLPLLLGILRKQRNTTVLLGEVTRVDSDRRCVFVNSLDREGVVVEYDYLILATGASHSYFGHDEFERFAPGLKNLADADAIRNRVLKAFEQAEAEEDPRRHGDLLTFVLVGAGPTGVEMASAMADLVSRALRAEFRRIDPTSARIVLVDMGNRVLATFSEKLSAAAKHRLEALGVEVRLGHGVDHIDAEGVMVAGERIASKTVIWTAGVAPSPAAKWLKAATDRAGRVRVEPDLTVPAHPEIFVIGDTASLEQDGRPL